jgi:hypothetical protein
MDVDSGHPGFDASIGVPVEGPHKPEHYRY